MRAPDIRERLNAVEPPERGAAERRAWAVVHTAFGRRATSRRGRQPVVAVAAALLLVVSVTTIALTPPGAALADWVQHVLGDAPPTPRTSLGPLPGGGRMLVTAAGQVWVIKPDGSRRAVARADGATWSPRGRFIATWRGTTLSAVTPDGRVAWRQTGAGQVSDASWSPDGYRIAYRRGDALWVVAGDGSGARAVDGTARPVPAVWRPGAAQDLTWVDARGHITVREPDSGRLVWRAARVLAAARRLEWSPRGKRLAVVNGSRVRIFDLTTSRVSTAGWHDRRVRSVAWSPATDQIAMIVQSHGSDLRSLVLVRGDGRPERRLFTGTRLGEITWSPSGNQLLVGWPHADQWLLVPLDTRARLSAVGGLGRRFGGQPVVRGWCCTSRDQR